MSQATSGDDGNGMLDPNEQWTFRCTRELTEPGTLVNQARAAAFVPESGPVTSETVSTEVVVNAPPPAPLWPFTGFFQPVDTPPVVNVVKAGSTVPVKFSLGGARGLDIFDPGFPASRKEACSEGQPDALEEIAAPGAAALTYDAVSGQYQFNWKTLSSWIGTCRRLVVDFGGGGPQEALFRFR